jgi:hypothetical protein
VQRSCANSRDDLRPVAIASRCIGNHKPAIRLDTEFASEECESAQDSDIGVPRIVDVGNDPAVRNEQCRDPAPAPPRDGAHDFDFLIGDWKAHVRRLPDRLVGSDKWVEYDGISRHKKLLDSNANFEEFEVNGRAKDQHKCHDSDELDRAIPVTVSTPILRDCRHANRNLEQWNYHADRRIQRLSNCGRAGMQPLRDRCDPSGISPRRYGRFVYE